MPRLVFVTNGVISRHATMKRAFGLAPGLASLGWDCFCILEEDADNRLALGVVGNSLAPLWYQGGRSARATRQAKESLIRDFGEADVVFACGLGLRNFVRRREIPRARLVLMDHVELESSLPGVNPLLRAKAAWLEWSALREYKHHVFASKYLCEHFSARARRFGIEQKSLYLNYGGEWKRPERSRPESAHACDRLVVYMGGWYKSYGVLDLIDAFHRVATADLSARLMFCGRGPLENAMRQKIARLALHDRVEILGYLPSDKVNLLLSHANVLVSPLHDTVADWARCPSKIPTYAQAGGHVVTAPVGEALEYLGNDGFYYQPGNIGSMAQAMMAALATPKRAPDPANPRWDWHTRSDELNTWLRGQLDDDQVS